MDKTKLIICLKESLGSEFDCYISQIRAQYMITIEIIKQFGDIKPKDIIPHNVLVDFSNDKK